MFECDKCGECCRNLNKSPLYDDLHNGNGVCFYLKDNICTIYADRPLLCNVDKCYEAMFKEILSYKEYLELNYKYCNELKNLRRK
ncbi:MAG: YkgJ family cysteine cluster protein [Eubacteriales bacterium]